MAIRIPQNFAIVDIDIYGQNPYCMRRKMTKVQGIQDMDNPERSRYFRVIDQLRAFGINEDLPLPQASRMCKRRHRMF